MLYRNEAKFLFHLHQTPGNAHTVNMLMQFNVSAQTAKQKTNNVRVSLTKVATSTRTKQNKLMLLNQPSSMVAQFIAQLILSLQSWDPTLTQLILLAVMSQQVAWN